MVAVARALVAVAAGAGAEIDPGVAEGFEVELGSVVAEGKAQGREVAEGAEARGARAAAARGAVARAQR